MKKAIVTTYYPDTGGVSTYSKYLFEEVQKIDKDVIVLASKIDCNYSNNNVLKSWDKNPLFVFQILRDSIKNKIKIIHIQQEMHIFGSKLNSFFLPLLVLLLRILRKKVIITIHGVVPLKSFNKDFMKENGYSGNPLIIKWILLVLYFFISLFPNRIIVHEKKFKEYLKDYYVNVKKVDVIGHGIRTPELLLNKYEAKKKIGLKNNKYTFLYFGYITGYKGIDLIVSALKMYKDLNFNFIVVGSKHPRLKHEKEYQKYYNKIKSFFEKDKRCLFTGYVEENLVDNYFRAADCLILPYTVQMSSSGPMALGFANENLILGSDVFEGVLPDEFLFERNANSLVKMMREAKNNDYNDKYYKIIEIKNKLSWKNIAKETLEVYYK